MKPTQDITAEEVEATLEKVTTEFTEVRYLTRDLASQVEEMACNAASFHMLNLILGGIAPGDAGKEAADSVIPLTFHLGLLVGRELEASEAFAQMMGGINGPSTDAGDSEHGSE